MAQNENTQILDSTEISKSNVELLQTGLDFPIQSSTEALIATNIGLAVFDRHLHFTALNQRFSDIDGRSVQYHIGKTPHQVVGSLSGQYDSAIRNVFAAGQCLTNVKIVGKIPRRVQLGKWVGNFFPLINSDSRVTHVGVFVYEIEASSSHRHVSERAIIPHQAHCSTRPPVEDFVDDLARTESSRNLVPSDHPSCVLSPREQEILGLLARGDCNKEIAWFLGLSVKTVESHRSRIMLKLGAQSLVHLVHYAIKHEVVEIQY